MSIACFCVISKTFREDCRCDLIIQLLVLKFFADLIKLDMNEMKEKDLHAHESLATQEV